MHPWQRFSLLASKFYPERIVENAIRLEEHEFLTIIKKTISLQTYQNLVNWALSDSVKHLFNSSYPKINIPEKISTTGAHQIIDYIIENYPESDAAKFWMASRVMEEKKAIIYAYDMIRELMTSLNWHRAWALAALCALQVDLTLGTDPGAMMGLEYSRAILIDIVTTSGMQLDRTIKYDYDRDSLEYTDPPTIEESPFGDPTVREVLLALDLIVALQNNYLPYWSMALMQDLSGVPDKGILAFRDHFRNDPDLFNQIRQFDDINHRKELNANGQLGSFICLQTRALSEIAETSQNFNDLEKCNEMIRPIACRYGYTSDVIKGFSRYISSTARLTLGKRYLLETMLFGLENIKLAAIWLGDLQSESDVLHRLGLLLREGIRKTIGYLEAIAYFQRAIQVRYQLAQDIPNEYIAAIGSQIDMVSVFLMGNIYLGILEEAPEEAKQWPKYSEMYLQDAIQKLTLLFELYQNRPNEKIIFLYLGEAYFNLARLKVMINEPHEAKPNAQIALSISYELEHRDMEARTKYLLGKVSETPKEKKIYFRSSREIVQEIRRRIQQDDQAISWVTNKTPVFESELSYLFKEYGKTIDEVLAVNQLLEALEDSRGLIYNRKLNIDFTFNSDKLFVELNNDQNNPVFAIYVLTNSQVGLIVLEPKKSPKLFKLNLRLTDLEEMVANHYKGLRKLRYLYSEKDEIWHKKQLRYLATGKLLVDPLEPYIKEKRTICFFPHLFLHGASFHVLVTSSSNLPIGLRTEIFQNPSLTNWLAAKTRTYPTNKKYKAFIGSTAPVEEIAKFSDTISVIHHLEDKKVEIVAPEAKNVDLHFLSQSGSIYDIFHLACHGVFNPSKAEVGLLLSSNKKLPASLDGINDSGITRLRKFITSPEDLLEHKIGGILTFLSSCLSARNIEFPGDDLTGLTRTFFANGSADFIAGIWTVSSKIATEFVDAFYKYLGLKMSISKAMFETRKKISIKYPNPFLWGAFVHQGSNLTVFKDKM